MDLSAFVPPDPTAQSIFKIRKPLRSLEIHDFVLCVQIFPYSDLYLNVRSIVKMNEYRDHIAFGL